MKKLLNKKGFTLMEMLIVVAIIVILVCMSIPVFSSQLNSAKKATDDANLRAAKAAAVSAYYITDDSENVATGDWYNLETGKFSSTAPTAYGQASEHSGMAIQATVDATNGTVNVAWAAVTSTP